MKVTFPGRNNICAVKCPTISIILKNIYQQQPHLELDQLIKGQYNKIFVII